MKTLKDINDIISLSADEYRTMRDALRSAVDTLETIYRAGLACNETPAATVGRFVEAVGHDMAVNTIATLVNRSAWDGRIGKAAERWANAQPDSLDEDAALRLGLYTNVIHMAHLDQIASAMIKFDRDAAK